MREKVINKTTILFVQNIEYPQQGGIDIFYYSKILAKNNNFKIKVIISKINENISSKNLELTELGNGNYFLFIVKAFFKIWKKNKEEKIDYVYFFAQHPLSIMLQFFVKYFLGIRTIYDVVSGPIGKGILAFISKNTIKLGVLMSDSYVIINEGLITKIDLPKGKKHAIVGMGYDKELFFENKNINIFNKKEGEILFTYIGTLNEERNLDIFLKSFIYSIKSYPNIKLYFIGSGTGEKQLQNLSGKYIGKKIFFLGKKEHTDIPDYINSSDILVSYIPKVAYFEYQPPTKLIEYLACNKPVMATNTIAQVKIMNGLEDLVHEDDFGSTSKKIQYFVENYKIIKLHNYKGQISGMDWKSLLIKIEKILISN